MNNFEFRNKRVLVLGLGLHGGGVGAVKFLARHGAHLTVTDQRPRRELKQSLEALRSFKNIRYVLGMHRDEDILAADVIIKNPGVPWTSPYLALARKNKIPITSDIGIFFARCPGRIIGVTGTRGKSTSAYLIWRFLKTRKRRVFLGGNIRKSALEFLDGTRPDDIIILELSSFQLEDVGKDDLLSASGSRRSPEIAVFTNILTDHLNRHAGMRDYVRAKSVIFRFQKPTDYLFVNPDDTRLRRLVKAARSRVRFPSLPGRLKQIVLKNLGAHYISSVALAVGVARHFGVLPAAIQRILASFRGLEGRQEAIAAIRGAQWINDTTSTVPDATIAALERFGSHKPKGKIILIAGGQDKKLDFRAMARAIKKYVWRLILLPGTATEKIRSKTVSKGQMANGKLKITEVASMREAVRAAAQMTEQGDCVILSPGAASFGLFLNEFDRGRQFNEEVKRSRR